MSRWFHVWWLLIIALIVGAIIVLYGMFNTSQQLHANTLYDAVRQSAVYARDDSDRESRGAFVINTQLFRKRLAAYKINNINAVGAGGGQGTSKNTTMYIHYLADNQSTDSINSDNKTTAKGKKPELKSKTNVRNGYVDSLNYENASHNENGSIPKYLPIRAIQVQAVPNYNKEQFRKGQKDSKKETTSENTDKNVIKAGNNDKSKDLSYLITNVNSKYIATLVVQDQKSPINGNHMTNKDLARLNQGTGDKPEYGANNPINDPNKTTRNSVDLTVPSYYGNGSNKKGTSNEENGNSSKVDASADF